VVVWDEQMEEGQMFNAVICNEQEPQDTLVRGTCNVFCGRNIRMKNTQHPVQHLNYYTVRAHDEYWHLSTMCLQHCDTVGCL